MVRMVPRGVSTTADAYLTPVLSDYLDGFYQGFEGGKAGDLVVEFMGSDGGLLDLRVRYALSGEISFSLSTEFHRPEKYLVRPCWRRCRLCKNEL